MTDAEKILKKIIAYVHPNSYVFNFCCKSRRRAARPRVLLRSTPDGERRGVCICQNMIALADAFGTRAHVLPHPDTGAPVVIPAAEDEA